MNKEDLIAPFDERRTMAIFASSEEASLFASDLFFQYGHESINQRGRFTVAVPGGSTPTRFFELLRERKSALDWGKVYLFFTDERMASLDSPECNFRLAYETFFHEVSPKENLFPMVLSQDPVQESLRYEKILKYPLDFVLLGMGEDGHIASLFPKTRALSVHDRRVSENYIPEKGVWRVTLTYKAIDEARHVALLAFGEKKAPVLTRVFSHEGDPILIPSRRVGTIEHPALWILDAGAAGSLCSS